MNLPNRYKLSFANNQVALNKLHKLYKYKNCESGTIIVEDGIVHEYPYKDFLKWLEYDVVELTFTEFLPMADEELRVSERYLIGSRFIIKDLYSGKSDEVILCQICQFEYRLIDLCDGNRFHDEQIQYPPTIEELQKYVGDDYQIVPNDPMIRIR